VSRMPSHPVGPGSQNARRVPRHTRGVWQSAGRVETHVLEPVALCRKYCLGRQHVLARWSGPAATASKRGQSMIPTSGSTAGLQVLDSDRRFTRGRPLVSSGWATNSQAHHVAGGPPPRAGYLHKTESLERGCIRPICTGRDYGRTRAHGALGTVRQVDGPAHSRAVIQGLQEARRAAIVRPDRPACTGEL
jgi:hypothetical protein